MVFFNAKPLRDADALIERGDYPRASEKLWDAVCQGIKTATREWAAESPREMRRLLERLFRETGDRELLRLFSVVESLRENAGENFMSAEAVKAHAEDAAALAEKLAHLADRPGGAEQGPGPGSRGGADGLDRRQREFSRRIEGMTRRDTRREVLAELARVEAQIDNLRPSPVRSEAAIPGFPEARIASALQQLERLPREDRATAELMHYKTWLVELLVKPAPAGP